MTEQRLIQPSEIPAGAGVHEQLFASLYIELHRLAQRELRQRGFFLTLGATTLLHEAYVNLSELQSKASFADRAHFFAYAARAMRRLIVDFARNRQALKRGGAFEITSLPTEVPEQATTAAYLARIDEAVERLAALEPRLAQVVEMKYFSGFSFSDIAIAWGVSERTVRRDWQKARLFLHRALTDAEAP